MEIILAWTEECSMLSSMGASQMQVISILIMIYPGKIRLRGTPMFS